MATVNSANKKKPTREELKERFRKEKEKNRPTRDHLSRPEKATDRPASAREIRDLDADRKERLKAEREDA